MSDFCDRMHESDGMIVRHFTDPSTYAHLESKCVSGTLKGLEPHHPTMEKGTYTPDTKKHLRHICY